MYNNTKNNSENNKNIKKTAKIINLAQATKKGI